MKNRKQTKTREADVPLDEAVGFLLHEAARLMNRGFSKRLARHGIQIGVFPFLRALWGEDGLTLAELAERVGRKGPTAVAALQQMERDGMIRRVVDKADKRRSYLYLTARGREFYTKSVPDAESHMKSCLSGFSQREREAFKSFLHRFRANLRAKSGETFGE